MAESLNRKLIQHHHVEGLTRLMGVGLHSFNEFNKQNIDSFNLVCMNSNITKVKLYYFWFLYQFFKYFSIGASKKANLSSEMLRANVKYISENKIKNFITDNDGAFIFEETKWGKHLFNCVADHTDLIGLGFDKDWEKIYRFCVDNIKFEEQDQNVVKQRNIEFV